MAKRYIVRLSNTERRQLQELVGKGKAPAYKIKHAHILLKADADGPAWSDERSAEGFGCHRNTVFNVRQRFVEQGLAAALERKPRVTPGCQPVCDGEAEAKLIALRCGAPPRGPGEVDVTVVGGPGGGAGYRARHLPRDRAPGTKKNELKPHLRQRYVIPPQQSADFVARRLVERLDIHYTSKHGRWLNIAENELSALTRQCLDRRIPDQETLTRETKAWQIRRNESGKSVDWQFTTDGARPRLKRLYPQTKS